ncbi:hypothetical protein HMPREF1624_00042 [Sporothrix schenckii ATCC 58251]|uniref:F-box domain-containing protein n=1 Tax=Sporothrix schenckii (strain ATCC 58251 / de Perez 2211183) TaxID=1391915 RepID=U7Q1K9_SPOS1|nr:hypothetical protein HMPREF1624_00042 [Sporothrix schenckii ATCC 58251]
MDEQLQSTPPAPKRRLLSRAVTLGHPPKQNDESYDGAVQFHPLSLGARSSSAQAAPTPTTNHQDLPSSPQPVAASIKFDLMSSISSCLDIVLNVCTFLDLSDILTLYRVSRVFKATFDNELEGNVMRMARQFASAETVRIFPFWLFPKATIPLPFHADDNRQHSRAPTLRYVNMLVSRERKVRDIVASLARAGHRLPPSTATAALKKMWLLMDIPTNQDRMNMLQDEELFSNADLLTIHMFHVKLVLYFHDPLFGPDISLPDTTDVEEEQIVPEPILEASGTFGVPAGVDMNDVHNETSAATNVESILWQQLELPGHALVETLLGQRGGFDVLWNFLRGKAFRSFRDVIELKVRYDYAPPAMDAVDHNAAQILSSMATAENAETFGNFLNPIEGFSDLANFDFKFDFNFDFNFDEFIDFDQGRLPETAEDKNTTVDDVLRLVPAWEMGIGHLEGWGTGTQHLLRPDELVPLEAARRMRANPDEHVDLTNHVPYMGVWGNRDFTTGENLIPSVEELYISDSEEDNIVGQIDSGDDGDNDKENMGTLAVASVYEMRSVVALVNKQFENYRYPTSRRRMDDRCGNVVVDEEDWQPYLSLKSRWSTLTLQEKLDVWWENHQQRLWRQAWTQRGDNDQRASSSNNNNNNVNNNIDDVSYTQPDDPANDDGDGDDDDDGNDADNEEGYDIGSDCDEDMMDGDSDSDQDEDNVDRYQSGDGSGSPSSSSHKPALHGTRAPSTPLAPPPPSSSSSAAIPLPDTSQNLSRRHQRLVRSCIRWALNEQGEVDAALLAQADMVYEEEELQHWDAFMAAAMAAGNPIFGGAPAGSDFGTEDGHDIESDVDNNDDAGDDHLPSTPVPNAEDVLAPEFGSIGDVVRLVRQVNDCLAAAEKARKTLRSDDPDTASTASVRLSDLVKEAEELQSQLAAVLQGEVFAIEL